VGRFTTVDEWAGDINNPISLNKYLYGYGNPGIYIDPDGRVGFLTSLSEKFDETDQILRGMAVESGTLGFIAASAGRALVGLGSAPFKAVNTASDVVAQALPSDGAFAGVSEEGSMGLAPSIDAAASPIQTGKAIHAQAVATSVAFAEGDRGAASDIFNLAGQAAGGGVFARIGLRGNSPNVAEAPKPMHTLVESPDAPAVTTASNSVAEEIAALRKLAARLSPGNGIGPEGNDAAIMRSIRRASGATGSSTGKIIATADQTEFILRQATRWRRDVNASRPAVAALPSHKKGTLLHGSVQRRIEPLNIDGLVINQRMYGSSPYNSPVTGKPYEFRIPDYRMPNISSKPIFDIKPEGTPLSGPQYNDFRSMGGTSDVRWIEYEPF